MDIDLLWTLGGVLLFFQSNYYCMATSSQFSTFKSQSFLYFITLFFIFLILVHSNHHHDPNYSSSSSSSSSSTSSKTRATMKLHPRKIPKNQAEYGGAAHEVPSGPNPISNR
ncbi:hypothetical protein R3W88_024782 [Solanum pinnatisectum]|uniref:Uncharacterized protein n=1 Tax=Solanum pinnatisectum TaxID=50273 RepID=A0AAV9M4K0_9SOLN|nr:hypothetical protein R3W88_024782 [Solanum pinnatisectum]